MAFVPPITPPAPFPPVLTSPSLESYAIRLHHTYHQTVSKAPTWATCMVRPKLLPCHLRASQGPKAMSYSALAPHPRTPHHHSRIIITVHVPQKYPNKPISPVHFSKSLLSSLLKTPASEHVVQVPPFTTWTTGVTALCSLTNPSL